MAFPKPRLAPVTIAFCPASFPAMAFPFCMPRYFHSVPRLPDQNGDTRNRCEDTRQSFKTRLSAPIRPFTVIHIKYDVAPSIRKEKPPAQSDRYNRQGADFYFVLRFANELRHQASIEPLDAFLGAVSAFFHAAKR